jgi:3-hydroxymyristoyl/3-hydroxydecanoyl-(acyl carrier protein) dehydratase
MRGVEVRRAEGGTLEVSGPHLPGPGWHPTADRILLEGGAFTLLGRADRVVKIEEKRVSLEQVERGACATGLLLEARAVVILAGERVGLGLAGVPSEEAKAVSRSELVARLKAALGTLVEPVAVPRRYRLVDALPTDARGKVTEEALGSLFRPERPTPRWTERTPTRATLQLLISSELRTLDGHFPEVPIVPGVAQLAWAIHWGREVFRFQGHPSGVDALKFQRLLLVGDRAQLDLEWNAERSTLAFRYTASEDVYSSGKVVLSP